MCQDQIRRQRSAGRRDQRNGQRQYRSHSSLHVDSSCAVSLARRSDQDHEFKSLTIELKVTNAGSESLPFGLGHHPHFAWRPETFVKLGPGGRYWSEDARYMPEAIVPFPADVDFSEFAAPPLRRVNNLIEDWSRQADVIWKNEGLSLTMTASDAFRFLMVFVRAPATPSGEHSDFFCLEPMTHRVGGHEQGDGGLATLRPGDSMSGSIRFVVGRNPRSP